MFDSKNEKVKFPIKDFCGVSPAKGVVGLSDTLAGSLLDSSLIVTTNKKIYNYKVIYCNDYIQIYKFNSNHIKKDDSIESIKKVDTDLLYKKNENKNIKIEIKNINRSKLECQRLAKCNSKEWKTFITLTFAENVKDIKIANKKFRYFIDKIQRIKKNLKYICIPEFQKRGAVHYHLITNINIDDERFIYSQNDNNYFKHIKYWNEGFNKVDTLDNNIKKIIGYISKYMTKDIDNRLYNRHRYFYSRNLNKPKISFIDINNDRDFQYLKKIINNKELIYKNDYINIYNNDIITFEEYLSIDLK